MGPALDQECLFAAGTQAALRQASKIGGTP